MSPEDDAPTRKPVRRFVLLAALLGAVIVVTYYFWLRTQAPAPPSAARIELRTEQGAGTGQVPRHPVAGEAPKGAPLPPLAESDPVLRARAEALVGDSALERLFNLDAIVRRVVVTVDNLAARRVPQRYSLARAVPERFRAVEDGDVAFLSAKNYARYEPWVKLARSVDTDKLVAAYMHFYPLFQKEYENLGYRDAYFNDRVVAVIDELLAAPEPKGRVRLVRPRVMYEYADPELESLSAGQKMLLRMGPENAAAIKTKLREIRAALAAPR